mmetsp:Transcript_5252/g.13378  ORF Transcript_5252/g.13378 Transcript_5252/m.13378 type:complete len:217 (+) Transcript_5252:309-959(+)
MSGTGTPSRPFSGTLWCASGRGESSSSTREARSPTPPTRRRFGAGRRRRRGWFSTTCRSTPRGGSCGGCCSTHPSGRSRSSCQASRPSLGSSSRPPTRCSCTTRRSRGMACKGITSSCWTLAGSRSGPCSSSCATGPTSQWSFSVPLGRTAQAWFRCLHCTAGELRGKRSERTSSDPRWGWRACGQRSWRAWRRGASIRRSLSARALSSWTSSSAT